MNNDLKNIRENCHYCNSIAPRHTKEPLILTPDPEFPFQEVAGDFFFVKGHTYLVLVDRYSGWFTVSHFKPHQATTKYLINECIALFTSYGAPEVFSSDGGTQFTSVEFQTFLNDWNIKHRISAPHYPQSNGRAEAAVKSAKRIISDYVSDSDPFNHVKIAEAIIQHRNTPLPDLKLSPAQLLFHRQIRDKLPTHPQHLRLHKQWVLTSMQRERLFHSKNQAALQRYNNISKRLVPIKVQSRVLILTRDKRPRWTQSGIVVMELPFRRYKIKLDGSGRIITRNRRFIRACSYGKHMSDNLEYLPLTSLTEATPDLPVDPPTPRHSRDIESTKIPNKLQPYNKPGLMEGDDSYEYRTTRSNKRY